MSGATDNRHHIEIDRNQKIIYHGEVDYNDVTFNPSSDHGLLSKEHPPHFFAGDSFGSINTDFRNIRIGIQQESTISDDDFKSYKERLTKVVNQYFKSIYSGININFEKENDSNFHLKWKLQANSSKKEDNSTYEGIYYKDEKTIYVFKPSLKSFPYVLVHELGHLLKLTHSFRRCGDLMSTQSLIGNYRVSLNDIFIMSENLGQNFQFSSPFINSLPFILHLDSYYYPEDNSDISDANTDQ